MDNLPRTIYNPLAQDRVIFIKTTSETNGEYLLVEVELAPKGGNSLHYHTTFSEHFEVIEGTLSIELEKRIIRLKPGETALAPLHKLHRFFNEDASRTCRFRVTIKPARQFENTLRLAYGLVSDGLTNAKGVPSNFWHAALLFDMGETYLPGLPHGFQIWLSRLLAKEARRRGKHKELERYYLPLEDVENVVC